MKKIDELRDPRSCLSRAQSHEWVFTLLARDPAAPIAILAWVEARIKLGKNTREDQQIKEALVTADAMTAQRPLI